MKEIITTELLSKSFICDGEVNNVIKNMELKIYQEDFTVIMGSSGSGKSTLLYCLSGMDEVSSGKVLFDGEDITKKKERELTKMRKQKIGFVFQGINLIEDLTADENVMAAAYKNGRKEEEISKEVNERYKKLELEGHTKKFPNQMSGGQRQRVAICRALVNRPEVLFADEPTGALNSSQGQEVLDVFNRVHEDGQAVVMVTHDLKAAIRGNRLIYLKDGRIDGELRMDNYDANDVEKREEVVYTFLKERGW